MTNLGKDIRHTVRGLARAPGFTTVVIASLLYSVSRLDPVVFVMVSVSALLVVAAATLLPALRATRVDPAITMTAD